MKFIFTTLISAYVIITLSHGQQPQKPFNIKIVPAKVNHLSLDDLDQVKSEILLDMNNEIKELESQMAEDVRMKEKTSSNWALTVLYVFN
jgi:hypothetical protein